MRVSRYEADRIYSVCYYDRSQQYYYMKRFTAEMSDKMQFFLDEEGQADLVCRDGTHRAPSSKSPTRARMRRALRTRSTWTNSWASRATAPRASA